jgi:hypothetical protein
LRQATKILHPHKTDKVVHGDPFALDALTEEQEEALLSVRPEPTDILKPVRPTHRPSWTAERRPVEF